MPVTVAKQSDVRHPRVSLPVYDNKIASPYGAGTGLTMPDDPILKGSAQAGGP